MICHTLALIALHQLAEYSLEYSASSLPLDLSNGVAQSQSSLSATPSTTRWGFSEAHQSHLSFVGESQVVGCCSLLYLGCGIASLCCASCLDSLLRCESVATLTLSKGHLCSFDGLASALVDSVDLRLLVRWDSSAANCQISLGFIGSSS